MLRTALILPRRDLQNEDEPNSNEEGWLKLADLDFSGLGFTRGEVAVVTGAGNGIGREVALMLATSGIDVIAWDVERDSVDSVVEEIRGSGGNAFAVVADLANQEGVESAWNQTGDVGLPVQYLVNNAGPASTTDMSVSEGVRIAVGSYAAVAEGFVARHQPTASSVTFTASIAGNFMVGPTADWYPAAKAGIVGYMRHVAVKYRGAPRANCVAPGGTLTRRTAAAYASPESVEKLRSRPMGRAAEATEVAAVICFLLSPAASFVNGVTIPVDGAATWTIP